MLPHYLESSQTPLPYTQLRQISEEISTLKTKMERTYYSAAYAATYNTQWLNTLNLYRRTMQDRILALALSKHIVIRSIAMQEKEDGSPARLQREFLTQLVDQYMETFSNMPHVFCNLYIACAVFRARYTELPREFILQQREVLATLDTKSLEYRVKDAILQEMGHCYNLRSQTKMVRFISAAYNTQVEPLLDQCSSSAFRVTVQKEI